jgi:NAD(P)H-flavin reductase
MIDRSLGLVMDRDEMLPYPYRVVSKTTETPDTVTLVLEGLDGHQIAFHPGQFTMIYAFGVGEVPISVSGNPFFPNTLVHTVRAVGSVTNAIVDLEPGDVVGARGPYGRGWPMAAATGKDLLIVAGGIGLAPLRPAIIHALTGRAEVRSLSLIYGARTPADLLYKDDLLGWKFSPDIHVEVTVDRAPSDWWGDVGLVTNLLPRVSFDPGNTVAMVCGPEVMMRVVARELGGSGVAADHLWMSIERNMKCAIGFCGHCQYGSDFICKNGPVGSYAHFEQRLKVVEL